MSPPTSSSSPPRISLPSTRASDSSFCISSASDIQGTDRTHKSATRAVFQQHTHWDSEVNEDPWAAEINGKINVVDEPLQQFFRDYVPCHSEFNNLRPWNDPAEVFGKVPKSGQECKNYPHLVSSIWPLSDYRQWLTRCHRSKVSSRSSPNLTMSIGQSSRTGASAPYHSLSRTGKTSTTTRYPTC